MASAFLKSMALWNRTYFRSGPISIILITTFLRWGSSQAADFAPSELTKLTVNQQHLKQAWDVSQVSTRQDWLEWFRRLALELIKESTSHSLRACMKLVDVYQPLARELFNAAFLSCWTELYEQYQVGGPFRLVKQ